MELLEEVTIDTGGWRNTGSFTHSGLATEVKIQSITHCNLVQVLCVPYFIFERRIHIVESTFDRPPLRLIVPLGETEADIPDPFILNDRRKLLKEI